MEIVSFESLGSTQQYLLEKITSHELIPPIGVIARRQTDGIGSRDNSWFGEDGSLFASVAYPLCQLPSDLPLQSASIYFGEIAKEVLRKYNKGVWLKWPNDIYIDENKIGGIITKKIDDYLVFGIGININLSSFTYKSMTTDESPKNILKNIITEIEKKQNWKQILSNVRIEFFKNKKYFVHTQDGIRSLEDVLLLDDGSIEIDGKRVYSLR